MSSEDGPVSQLLLRILTDPATIKLATSILSGFLIATSTCVNREWNQIPVLVIFSSTLIYSILTLVVIVLKQRENVSNCELFKKVFGANANFNEVSSTFAMLFAAANLSGIMLIGNVREGFILAILSLANIIFLLVDWFISSRAIPEIEYPVPERKYCCCTKCLFGGFKKCPIFFNLIQAGCLAASLVMVTQNWRIGYHAIFYTCCTGFTIGCLILLTILQLSKKLSKKISTKSLPATKWQTYLLIIIAFYSMLAVAVFAPITTNESHECKIKIYVNETVDKDSNNYYKRNNLIIHPESTEEDQRPFYYHTKWDSKLIYAPSELPIAFALSTLAFLISLFRLHPFVMPSSKQASAYENEDNAHEPLHDETQTTNDAIIEKFSNLPTVIEFLQNAEEIKKQPPILS